MISIINKVDLKPLNVAILGRVKAPKYLIMSEDTFKALEGECLATLFTEEFKFCTYRGVPIATCNSLPFGDIDIID